MKARGFQFKNWYFCSSACCRQQSVSHRYLFSYTMVQWLACDIPHLKRILISSVLQLKKLASVQWLTVKQCNNELVTFLEIRDILIGQQAQSQSNFLIIATSIIVFIIIAINCHLASFQTWSSSTIYSVATCHP